MAWALEDCDRLLRITERQIEYGHLLKERLQEEQEIRKKAKKQLETKGAELEGARSKLMIAQTELAHLKETFLKYQEDVLMEVS